MRARNAWKAVGSGEVEEEEVFGLALPACGERGEEVVWSLTRLVFCWDEWLVQTGFHLPKTEGIRLGYLCSFRRKGGSEWEHLGSGPIRWV